MRKISFLLLLTAWLPGVAQVRAGLRGGLNISNILLRWEKQGSRINGAAVPRFNGGLQFEIPLDENWYLHTGPYYSGKGANMFATDSTSRKDSLRVRLNYIEFPVLAAYQFYSGNQNRFIVSSGPYLGYGFKGTISWKGNRPPTEKHIHRPAEEKYRRFETGLMLSALYEIKSRYGIRVDFSKSLLNIHHPEERQKSMVMGFSFYWYVNEKKVLSGE